MYCPSSLYVDTLHTIFILLLELFLTPLYYNFFTCNVQTVLAFPHYCGYTPTTTAPIQTSSPPSSQSPRKTGLRFSTIALSGVVVAATAAYVYEDEIAVEVAARRLIYSTRSPSLPHYDPTLVDDRGHSMEQGALDPDFKLFQHLKAYMHSTFTLVDGGSKQVGKSVLLAQLLDDTPTTVVWMSWPSLIASPAHELRRAFCLWNGKRSVSGQLALVRRTCARYHQLVGCPLTVVFDDTKISVPPLRAPWPPLSKDKEEAEKKVAATYMSDVAVLLGLLDATDGDILRVVMIANDDDGETWNRLTYLPDFASRLKWYTVRSASDEQMRKTLTAVFTNRYGNQTFKNRYRHYYNGPKDPAWCSLSASEQANTVVALTGGFAMNVREVIRRMESGDLLQTVQSDFDKNKETKPSYCPAPQDKKNTRVDKFFSRPCA